MNDIAQLDEVQEDGREVLRFAGPLTLARLGRLPDRLKEVEGRGMVVDVSGVERMDTVGAWLIHRLVRDHDAEVRGADESTCFLLENVAAADRPAKIRPDQRPASIQILDQMGTSTVLAGRTLLGLLGFFGGVLVTTWNVIKRPRRFRFNATVQRFEVVGVHALGIIGLMSFLIGIVIAQQGAVQLRQFGAEVFTINLVGRLSFRELGVLMTAIMVAGRSGSAFAAQLGSMKLAEEVDAMRTIGVSPMEALVLPRVMATVLMMPLLGFYSSVIAVIGGGLLCWVSLDIPPVTFIQRIREVTPITDVWISLIKAPVFGAIIGIAGCFQGMQVEGNNEEVGLRTTSAVVQAIFLVIVLDAFFAVFFSEVGWI
ncbi:MAG TPA: MlaE family lipid ABC transporter permease subunit [Allosphingosinicella sp.]